jgi:hypothetical protein
MTEVSYDRKPRKSTTRLLYPKLAPARSPTLSPLEKDLVDGVLHVVRQELPFLLTA